MSEWKAKRFWTEATVVPLDQGFTVELDGRSVKTPGKALLVMPTRALAAAVAEEWQAQGEMINPMTMPTTRTANSAIDKVAVQHDEVATLLAAYGDSDLLCYRADRPVELVARQAAAWDPLLDWGETELGARLEPRVGVMHAPQDPEALAALARQTRALPDFELTAFHDLVSLSGSLIIGFAAARGAWPAEELWEISRLDELFQIEQWGRDEEAEAMAAAKRESFLHARRIFDLLAD
ncbi:MAG: ATP12 family protein [Pseudomonadota bacterium]